jgi:hypothetical protein
MNCATHSDVAAAAYCRTCGKALCTTCTRNVQGVIYCEGCLAARLGDAPTFGQQAWQQGMGTTASPTKPGLALWLGFIPGVGAMYNGQFLKGFMHALGFIILIWLADRVGPATIPVFFIYVFYMVFDAYKTAQALERGEAPPDFLGLERVFGPSVTRTHGYVVTAVPPTNPPPAAGMPPMGEVPLQGAYGGAPPAAPARAWHGLPVGAIVLIGIGLLFLLDNLGFDFPVHRFWPVILIVLGVWLVAKRWNRVS